MNGLAKSLAELDELADEMLMKSSAAEDTQDKDEDVKPEEISDDSTDTDADAESNDAEDTNDEESNDEVKKSGDVEDITDGANDADMEKSCGGCDDTKKSEDSEEIPAADEEAEDEDEAADEEEVEKSIRDDFAADERIQKGMEASEFLGAIVEVISKSLSGVQYDVISGQKTQAGATDILAKSLKASLDMNAQLREDNARLTRRINKIEKSMASGFDRIMDSLDEISSQPVGMRKSVGSMQVIDRNFGASIEGTPVKGGFDSLNKSTVMDILTREMYAGNPSVSTSDIIGYESGAPLRQDLQQLVVSKAN